eukprot:6491285-Amphidinium_carterae.6
MPGDAKPFLGLRWTMWCMGALLVSALRFWQGRFTGRDLQQDDQGNITVSQVDYINGLELLDIPRSRRQDRKSPLTPTELTMLRGKVGELNWIQGVSRPDLSGSVCMLQGSFGSPTVFCLLE